MTIGCRSLAVSPAAQAAVADTVSTEIALRRGFSELNPLGYPATVVVKTMFLSLTPDPYRTRLEPTATSLWSAAAANNVAQVLGFGSLWSPLIAVLTGFWIYRDFSAAAASQLENSRSASR